MHYLGIFISTLLLNVFCAHTAISADVSVYDFSHNSQWLKLLHYKKTANNQYKGLIETPAFYVSKQGRTNPETELKAEIKSFAEGQEKCRFPARFLLLRQYGFVQGNLDDCEEYSQFIKDVQPVGITVLFTNAFMNNPASMFGHTLVRIDTARKGTQMLAHGSNFGANSGTDTGVIFALKGLFGGYVGTYNLNPYWTTINTYNNIENRDIWEYHLNLSDEEIDRFVNHLYELKDAEIRYYFLNKNCSYMLLELLEASRPNLELTSAYQWWAIPLDTLKTIKSVDGLVDEVNYRPSRYTKISAMLATMDKSQQAAFLNSITTQDFALSDLSEEKQPLVLETLYQYYQYKYVAKDMEIKDYRRNSFAILRRRSQMSALAEQKISGQEPSLSHDSFQISASGGFYNHKSFEQINIKPAYTNLTDNNFGLIKGAEVAVLDSWWRYYNQKHRLVLQRFTPLKVTSLVPADSVFHPYSYETGIELRREYNPQNYSEGYAGFAQFGLGRTYDICKWLWIYGLIKVQGEYGGFLPHNQWLALTPKIGIFSEAGRFRFSISAEKRISANSFAKRIISSAVFSYGVTTNTSIEAETWYSQNKKGHDQREISLAVKYFF